MSIFSNPSLLTRIAIGKGMGAVIGSSAFFLFPMLMPEASLSLQIAFFFWYITLGAFVGLMGVMDRHPMFSFKLSAWIRGIIMGGWMNFMLVLLIPDTLSKAAVLSTNGALSSPYWFMLEGMIVAVLIDLVATRFGGEGMAAVQGYQRSLE